MSKHRDDDKLNQDQDFTLEEILAEFGDGTPVPPPADPPQDPGPDLPWPEAKHTPKPKNVVHFPTQPPEEPEEVDPGEEEPEPPEEEAPPQPPRPQTGQKPTADKVLSFPEEEPESPLQAGIEHLKRKADAFSQEMFRDEGVEVDRETLRAERLIPGVDEETAPQAPSRERRPRKEPEPLPDLPPNQLAARYGKGLGLLRLRAALVFLLALPQLWLTMAPLLGIPLPAALTASLQLRAWTCGGLLLAAVLLGVDTVAIGMARLFLLKPGADTLAAFACLATLADAFTQLQLIPERATLPYSAACTLSLFCCMRGTYAKRLGLRTACRTAAAASSPYLVTLDEGAWNNKDTYSKWSGDLHGFGSQVQEDDGAQRIYRIWAPLLLLAGVLCALIASVGQSAPERFLWCLSANLTAVAAFSGLLTFGRPFRILSRRLASSGAALAGWSGAARAGAAALLTDTDLFPPGTVSLNGIKVFGDFSVEKVVALCATLIRDSGSGLDKIFHDLLRSQGAVYRRCTDFQRHEGGGLSADVRGERVLVGSASFMALMEVPLPPGLNVRNAVFCAIDGELAGIFALNYVMHGSIPPALSALIGARLSPVLATRDFNLIPAMLRQKFKLPVERMDFPGVARRAELSDPDRWHNPRITAVLCREGLVPYADAVVGAKRLRWAVLCSTAIAVMGSVVGLLLSFYLTFIAAYQAIAPAQLTFFLCAWTVPTLLISGWVNRY